MNETLKPTLLTELLRKYDLPTIEKILALLTKYNGRVYLARTDVILEMDENKVCILNRELPKIPPPSPDNSWNEEDLVKPIIK